MNEQGIKYAKIHEYGHTIFIEIEVDGEKKTPTVISGGHDCFAPGAAIEIDYNYDCEGNTYNHPKTEYITRKDFYAIKRQKEANAGIGPIKLKKTW